MPKFIMSFDTEDYIDPAADDITKTLCETLERHGIRGSFCLVAERARQLVVRGRADVIAALKRHEIAFHSTWHSRHPNPAEYMDPLDWDDAVAEHLRREAEGVRQVKEIFDVEHLYAAVPPGSSWAPQGIHAYAALGIPIFAACSLSQSSGEPVRFVNSILLPYNLYLDGFCHMYDTDGLRKALDEHRSDEILITCNHPTILRHLDFVDAVNFGGGKNPPPEEWQLAPLRPQGDLEKILETFEEWCRLLAADGDYVQTSYAEIAREYAEQPGGELSPDDVTALAASVGERPDAAELGGRHYSPAEIFGILNLRLAMGYKGPVAVRRLLGPVDAAEPAASVLKVTRDELAEAARAVETEMRGRMPDSVNVAGADVPPGAYFMALAAAVRSDEAEFVIEPVAPGPPAAELPVFENIELKWACFAKDFTGENIKRMAALQAWTYKKATAS